MKDSFEYLKNECKRAVVHTTDEEKTLEIETDASYVSLAATLNQRGRPVTFRSRTLNPAERNYSPVEKEASAIIESTRE